MRTSPALLGIEDETVISTDFDCGIMITSPVPQYEKYKALLGNSDNIKEGDPIVNVGNPAMTQKFASKGIISNAEYSGLDMLDSSFWFKYLDKPRYNWIKNSCLWYDNSIGIGGTSGSGLWALTGSEAGKIIGLHNMGLINQQSYFGNIETSIDFQLPKSEEKIVQTDKKILAELLDKLDLDSVRISQTFDEFTKDNEKLKDEFVMHCGWVPVAGMNAAIPINKIKTFLQERGLDPEHFGWDGVSEAYWRK